MENGGDSLTALETLLELKHSGQEVSIEDVLNGKCSVNAADGSLIPAVASFENSGDYILKDLKDLRKDEVFDLLAVSFKKGQFNKYRPVLRVEDVADTVLRSWHLMQTHSFGYTDKSGKLKAVATASMWRILRPSMPRLTDYIRTLKTSSTSRNLPPNANT